MRGEYLLDDHGGVVVWELPPRARRILGKDFLGDFFIGTTSACAENTCWTIMAGLLSGNYLRVRGEYIPMVTILMRFLELPPRARRIRPQFTSTSRKCGTTSACAENTFGDLGKCRLGWNYLRVRGEYGGSGRHATGGVELPPRARRIRR